MTHRSEPHQPKTTTISRRLRDRADQNLSIQPPVIPQIRSIRSRRAATLPTPRHIPDYHTPGSHPPLLAWDTSNVLEDIPRSNTPHPTNPKQNRSHDLLLARNLDLQPHGSPPESKSDIVPFAIHQTSRFDEAQSTQRLGFLPSPLSSASGSHDFELPHETLLDLQDMRYAN
jgi:hypothetical protein